MARSKQQVRSTKEIKFSPAVGIKKPYTLHKKKPKEPELTNETQILNEDINKELPRKKKVDDTFKPKRINHVENEIKKYSNCTDIIPWQRFCRIFRNVGNKAFKEKDLDAPKFQKEAILFFKDLLVNYCDNLISKSLIITSSTKRKTLQVKDIELFSKLTE